MRTILIIEDNRTILENTAEILSLEGYVVLTATNGKNGLEKMYTLIPDLIICDLLMPEMDGFELLLEVGKNPKFSRIPVIFFSAKTEKKDIKKALDAGAVDYIIKPFELDDLVKTIKRCLKNRSNFEIN